MKYLKYFYMPRSELDRRFSEDELAGMPEEEIRVLAGAKWGLLWGVDFEDEKIENIKRALISDDSNVFYGGLKFGRGDYL